MSASEGLQQLGLCLKITQQRKVNRLIWPDSWLFSKVYFVCVLSTEDSTIIGTT